MIRGFQSFSSLLRWHFDPAAKILKLVVYLFTTTLENGPQTKGIRQETKGPSKLCFLPPTCWAISPDALTAGAERSGLVGSGGACCSQAAPGPRTKSRSP